MEALWRWWKAAIAFAWCRKDVAARKKSGAPASAPTAASAARKATLLRPSSCSMRKVPSVPQSTALVMSCQKKEFAEIVFTNR
jgi:hypothetical protein